MEKSNLRVVEKGIAIHLTDEFLEIRKNNPKLYKMHIQDKESVFPSEYLWVEESDEGLFRVENIPATDLINFNDLVEVEMNPDKVGMCKFVQRVKQVNASGWVTMKNGNDVDDLKEFITKHKIDAEQHSPGFIKLTWPVERNVEITEAFVKRFKDV